ncbi:MAG: bifunctional adenosylcobinamide kinase/adenosylcobinamide-phosphate guanylyltransferase [Anaerovoracaceae bacterium]|jgi:adenosyl cobinamide kinase/adenosyl cobinamide phosphate guanylyltransferase
MHLIFGGAYQGKLEYAQEHYQLKEEDIFTCDAEADQNKSAAGTITIDFSKKVINKLEDFVMCCLRQGIEAKEYLEEHKEEWKDKIIICTDISSGVVPYDKELRAWREMVGRTMVYLGKEAEEVTRLFCGIPQKLK